MDNYSSRQRSQCEIKILIRKLSSLLKMKYIQVECFESYVIAKRPKQLAPFMLQIPQ